MEVATLLTRIAVEEDDARFVAHSLRVMVLDAVSREGLVTE
jgi:hypothetical protein